VQRWHGGDRRFIRGRVAQHLEVGSLRWNGEDSREGTIVARKARECRVRQHRPRGWDPRTVRKRLSRADAVVATVINDATLCAIDTWSSRADSRQPVRCRASPAQRVDDEVRPHRAFLQQDTAHPCGSSSKPGDTHIVAHVDPRLCQGGTAQCPFDDWATDADISELLVLGADGAG